MGRLFGLCAIVLGVWAAAEIYSKGLSGAFGGALASSERIPDTSAAGQRAADAFQRAYDTSERRVDRLLEQQGD